MNWWRNLKGRVRLKEQLSKHTTFRIGGPAEFFIEPRDAKDLKLLLSLAREYNLSVFVIGAGSNLLISDKGIKGLVLRLDAPSFKGLSRKGNYLYAGSGASLGRVMLFAERNGLSGAEFLSGIPGTVGGALAMNAGVSSREPAAGNIGDLVKEVTVMDYAANIKTLQKKDIKFGYRKSSLSKYIILGATIRLTKGSRGEIRKKIKKYISYRKFTQDLSKPSAGCIFRNPPGNSAGKLIDLCGLKGKGMGGALISLKHANFILNNGNARARDIIKLMDLAKKRVKAKFNITLKPEIKIWQ